MSTVNYVTLVQNLDVDALLAHLREPLAELGWRLVPRVVEKEYWFHHLAIGINGSVATVYEAIPYGHGSRLGRKWWEYVITLDTARMTVANVHESFWEYTLRRKEVVLDEFRSLADGIIGDEDCWEKYRGNVSLLAQIWEVPAARIKKYLRWWHQPQILPADISQEEEDAYWDSLDFEGKAYEDDEFEYGDANQGFDFARAMGGMWPITPEWLHFELVPIP